MSLTRGALAVARPSDPVWRVGFRPDPLAWSPWQYTGSGRWDDPDDNWRVLYLGSLMGCLLEVLAPFRPDPAGSLGADPGFTGIIDNDPDAPRTRPPGVVPRDWILEREVGRANVSGDYCQVTSARSIAALREHLPAAAQALVEGGVDAAALQSAGERPLTQEVAKRVRAAGVDGIAYDSRHGNDEHLWAVFEQPGDPDRSPRLSGCRVFPAAEWELAIADAFELLGLRWEEIPEGPQPVAASSDSEAMAAGFPPDGEPTPQTALGCVFLWLAALDEREEYLHELHDLTYSPSHWDFEETAHFLGDAAPRQRVLYPADGSIDIAYIQMLSGIEETVQVFGHAQFEASAILTLVRLSEEEGWRVWGYGGRPATPGEIRGR